MELRRFLGMVESIGDLSDERVAAVGTIDGDFRVGVLHARRALTVIVANTIESDGTYMMRFAEPSGDSSTGYTLTDEPGLSSLGPEDRRRLEALAVRPDVVVHPAGRVAFRGFLIMQQSNAGSPL